MLPPRPLSIMLALAAALFGAVYAGEVQPPPQPAASPAPGAAQTSDEDAEKHLRRTACLRDARARKLVGAQRAAFVKGCLENTASDS